jgi:hypothetical protein
MSISRLRNNGAYSDLTLKCGDAESRVHEWIVCPQSTFYRNACEKQKWKVSDISNKQRPKCRDGRYEKKDVQRVYIAQQPDL